MIQLRQLNLANNFITHIGVRKLTIRSRVKRDVLQAKFLFTAVSRFGRFRISIVLKTSFKSLEFIDFRDNKTLTSLDVASFSGLASIKCVYFSTETVVRELSTAKINVCRTKRHFWTDISVPKTPEISGLLTLYKKMIDYEKSKTYEPTVDFSQLCTDKICWRLKPQKRARPISTAPRKKKVLRM